MPQALWSGNLRLSLVLVPVKLYSALSPESAVSFRMIHKGSGKPIRYVKGVHTDRGFIEVTDEEIVKGFEHTKGHHVLIRQEEIDELKIEAKHTINMGTFVDASDLDPRYFEKPYYLLPDGDDAKEGYVIMRDALRKTRKVAVGQLVMGGRQHIVGITAHGKGLMLLILRYADELHDDARHFDNIKGKAASDAVKLAAELMERHAGDFEPETMPNDYARAVRELVQAKIEARAPEIAIEAKTGKPAKVVNIMAALKKSIDTKGAKVRDVVKPKMKPKPSQRIAAARSKKPSQRAEPRN